MDAFDNSYGLHRESRAIGFDLAHFSYTVRRGLIQAHINLQPRAPDTHSSKGAS
jgi:hypothetical protein